MASLSFKKSTGLVKYLFSVYMGPDPFGTGTKLLLISLLFTQDLVDLVEIRSTIWSTYELKVIPYSTVSLQFSTVDSYHSRSNPKKI